MSTTKKKTIKIVKKKIKKTIKKEGGLLAEEWMPANRKAFPDWINTKFSKHLSTGVKTKTVKPSGQPGLFPHQRLISDYMSDNSPYRGLLLYHGLGSGKTCNSIAVAEGLKRSMKVFVFLPASLRPNYVAELKYCGDEAYYLQQHWVFDRCSEKSKKAVEYQTSRNIPAKVFRKIKGCWVSSRGTANFKSLTSEQQEQIHFQLEAMIAENYEFVHYNGLRKTHLDKWETLVKNPFNHKLIIIDEVHNFISRVVGGGDIGKRLYKLLLEAEGARFILLSGTPMINYPHESGILLNLLRGQMKTYGFTLSKKCRWTEEDMTNMLKANFPMIDYLQVNTLTKTIVLSILPMYFIRGVHGGIVKTTTDNRLSEYDFIEMFKNKMETLGFPTIGTVRKGNYLAYPDEQENFERLFIRGQELVNMDLFRSRMMGLVSYYQGAKDTLFPRSYMRVPVDQRKRLEPVLARITQNEAYARGNFVIPVSMSDYQFKKYEAIRQVERDLDTNENKKKKLAAAKSKHGEQKAESSYYRVFSRCFGNFVFPESLERPIPGTNLKIEDAEKIEGFEADEEITMGAQKKRRIELYNTQKKNVLTELDRHKEVYLQNIELEEGKEVMGLKKFSPKFAKIIDFLEESQGGTFVYSQFREMEGIGIFSKALEANGYRPFQIYQDHVTGEWDIDIREDDIGKPSFAFYTGLENPDLKEITKTIFNNEFDKLSEKLRTKLLSIYPEGNLHGQIIKVFLATSSAAEGITLCNVRQVHIMEPYWNPVRTEQVIGRAVRIGSHELLPYEEREVDIFIYVSTMTPKQLSSNFTIREKDHSLTSDEHLYQISEKKRLIMQGIMKIFKESSIDCTLNAADNEPVDCLSFPRGYDVNDYSFIPELQIARKTSSKLMKTIPKNTKKIAWRAKELTYQSKNFILNPDLLKPPLPDKIPLYSKESYELHLKHGSNLIQKGELILKPKRSINIF